MSQTKRPKLADLKRHSPQDLAHCEGYVWHLGSRIGKGSFGEVYLGWDSSGRKEVAVKVVRKEFFKQDPKVRENLEREIRILKLLRGCECVVHLFHVQEMKHFIVLVMELCEYDLDYLVKVKPFKEDDITLFLYQLGEGMKFLRMHNIVHRDLKPGNILITRHPHTGKMMIKLADFGFARHFKDEGMKPIDMFSLAGTPVFMAPEALRCVFHPGEHYDDKVDIWSIGALLYKVIVGQCGFYAQLQDIPRILKHKGDAIAFERVPRTGKIKYIHELPTSVNDRLSENFREKMNALLRALLKIDPAERMTFPEFFEFVEDLLTSKVEVINLLHGTSFKIIFDPKMTEEQLVAEIHGQTNIPANSQIIFSENSTHFLSPQSQLSLKQFREFLDQSGANEGHAILYLLPTRDVQEKLFDPDYSCLSKLIYAVDDPMNCVNLIVEQKFADELVHEIRSLQDQQKRQLTGMEEFGKFCSRELERFNSQFRYTELYQQGLQTRAQGSLAISWLMSDIDQVVSTSLPDSMQEQLKRQLQLVERMTTEIDRLVKELHDLHQSCQEGLGEGCQADLQENDLTKVATTLSDEAKKLPKMRKDYIHGACEHILQDCKQHITEVTQKVKKVLRSAYGSLEGVWRLQQGARELEQKCNELGRQLSQAVPQCRTSVLASLSTASPVKALPAQAQASPPTPPNVILTPPGPWSQPSHMSPWPAPYPAPHPSTSTTYPAPPQPFPLYAQGPDATTVASLKDERDRFKDLYEHKNKENQQLLQKMEQLKRQSEIRVRTGNSTGEEERTMVPGALRPHSPSTPVASIESTVKPGSNSTLSRLSDTDSRVLESLTQQLRAFCLTAEKLKPGISASVRPASPKTRSGTVPSPSSTALYPTLLDDYSVITLSDQNPGPRDKPGDQTTSASVSPQSVHTLIPEATQLINALQKNMSSLEVLMKNPGGSSNALVKMARPHEYGAGDLVLFHPIKLTRSRSTAPIMMHLEKPKPYFFLDLSSYNDFGIRPGRMPDLFLARLTEKPRQFRFEDDDAMAKDLEEKSGLFYRVKAKPADVKFAPPRPTSVPRSPSGTGRHLPFPIPHLRGRGGSSKNGKDYV